MLVNVLAFPSNDEARVSEQDSLMRSRKLTAGRAEWCTSAIRPFEAAKRFSNTPDTGRDTEKQPFHRSAKPRH